MRHAHLRGEWFVPQVQDLNYLIDFFKTGKLNHAVIYNFFEYSNENILKKCDEGKKYGEILYYKKDGKIHCAISSDVEEDIKSNNFTGKYPSELLDTFMLEYLDENDKLYTFNFVTILNYLFSRAFLISNTCLRSSIWLIC
jgi:hypothetical protein